MRRILAPIAYSFAGVAVYVASLGPMLAVCERFNMPIKSLEVVYAPVGLLHEIPAARAGIDRYLGMWIKRADCGGTGDGG